MRKNQPLSKGFSKQPISAKYVSRCPPYMYYVPYRYRTTLIVDKHPKSQLCYFLGRWLCMLIPLCYFLGLSWWRCSCWHGLQHMSKVRTRQHSASRDTAARQPYAAWAIASRAPEATQKTQIVCHNARTLPFSASKHARAPRVYAQN